MLLGLPSANESGVKVCDIDDQNRVVCLSSPCDHVRDEVPVTWRIEEYDVSIFQTYFLNANINGHPPCSLLFCLICHPREFKWLFTHLLRLFFIFMNLLFRHFMDQMHKLANKSWLSRVNVPNYHNVQCFWWFDLLLELKVRVIHIIMVCGVLLDH